VFFVLFRYTLTAHKGDFTEDAVRLFIEDVAVRASKSKDTVFASLVYIHI
jgi:hypothetical protein